MKRALPIILIAIFSITAACARVPTAKQSSNAIEHYFKKYGKKYKTTPYGKVGVKEVQITQIREVHKKLAEVDAFMTLNDSSVSRVHVTLEKKPLGWRFISWENASGNQ